MESSTEKQRPASISSHIQVRVLGQLTVRRNGAPVALPSSRKLQALLALLVLAPAGLTRSRLCDLLWQAPNDPRGELRWCLSKLRGVLDDAERHRVQTSGRDLVALDLSDCLVDVLEIERTFKSGLSASTSERLCELHELFSGQLLEDLELDGSPEFGGWLSAQRHRYHGLHVALLGELVARAPQATEQVFQLLGDWLRIAPFDPAAHEHMVSALVRRGRGRDAENHVAAAIRAFEQEGLDWSALRSALQSARAALAETPGAREPIQLSGSEPPAEPRTRRRASIAVMPFVDRTTASPTTRRPIADGLTEDIITRLAKLRVLFVIARGTVYALGERGIPAQEAGRILNVEYVVGGSLRCQGGRISMIVELAETHDARIVWTDEIEGAVDETLAALDSIVDRIVAAIAEEIESAECQRAMLKPPSSLDAWEAYHRGLWHMYRFTGPDNLEAARSFRGALELDPTFSRAHAGLSFTHFQNAFLDLTPDRERQIELALETAAQGLDADERDPASHWAMGRALWLNRRDSESLQALERSIELSPNFALGHYTLGFVHSQAGDPQIAIDSTDYSRLLSPFDPLQFAMLASRALAHLRLGQLEEAANWAVKATGRSNAHTHITAIAAHCLALANRGDEARKLVARIRERVPGYGVEHFLRAFRFDRATEQLLRKTAGHIGFG